MAEPMEPKALQAAVAPFSWNGQGLRFQRQAAVEGRVKSCDMTGCWQELLQDRKRVEGWAVERR